MHEKLTFNETFEKPLILRMVLRFQNFVQDLPLARAEPAPLHLGSSWKYLINCA